MSLQVTLNLLLFVLKDQKNKPLQLARKAKSTLTQLGIIEALVNRLANLTIEHNLSGKEIEEAIGWGRDAILKISPCRLLHQKNRNF
jgi:hypothetical protein